MYKYILGALLIFSTSVCWATDYGVQRVVNGHHVQRVQNFNHHHNDAFVVKQKQVEFDVDTFIGKYGYYVLGEELRQRSNLEKYGIEQEQLKQNSETEKLIGENEELRKLLREILLRLLEDRLNPGKPGNPIPGPVDPEEPVDPPKPVNAMAKVLRNNNCAKCHSDGSDAGGAVFFEADKETLKELTNKQRWSIYDRMRGHRLKERGLTLMPKGGRPVSDEEVFEVYLYNLENN
jgi:mono/diheme cytochrome c family protein